MPVAKVQMPDGRIGRFEVPEGTTEQQVLDFVAGSIPKPPRAWSDVPMEALGNLPESFGNLVADTVRPILHPIDTAESLASLGKGAYKNVVGGYDPNDPDVQAADAAGQYFKQNYGSAEGIKNYIATDPAAALGDLATLLTAGGGLAARAPGAVGRAGALARTSGRTIDPIAAAVRGVSKTGGAALDKIHAYRAVAPAERKIAKEITRIGEGSYGRGVRTLAQRLKESGPDAALVDAMGMGGQKMARAAANVPGVSAEIADEFVSQRAGLRGENLQRAADRLAPRRNLVEYDKQMRAAQTAISEPLYTKAFRANLQMESPEINKILNTPAGSEALRRAVMTMRNDRKLVSAVDPELTAALREAVELGKADAVPGGVGRGLKMRTLDYVKQQLYDMEQGAKGVDDFGRKVDTADSRAIRSLRQSLTSEMDNLDVTAKAGPVARKAEGGAYQQARAEFRNMASQRTALADGTKFINGDADVTAEALSKMTPPEKDAFRVGARKAITELINRDTKSAITKFADKKAGFWGRLKTVFPDEESFEAFRADVSKEIDKAIVDGFIGPRAGSQTAGLQQDIAGLSSVPSGLVDAVPSMVQGNWATALRQAYGGVKDRLTQPNQATAEGLARMLLTSDVAGRDAVMKRLASPPRAAARVPSAIPGIIQGAIEPLNLTDIGQLLYQSGRASEEPRREPLKINVRNIRGR